MRRSSWNHVTHPFVGVRLILTGFGGDGAVPFGSGSSITHVQGFPSLPSIIETFLFISRTVERRFSLISSTVSQ